MATQTKSTYIAQNMTDIIKIPMANSNGEPGVFDLG